MPSLIVQWPARIVLCGVYWTINALPATSILIETLCPYMSGTFPLSIQVKKLCSYYTSGAQIHLSTEHFYCLI